MAESWRWVRVPESLASRIDDAADRYRRAHAAGQFPLPAAYVVRVPAHWVISRALDALEGHRVRRRQARSKALRRPDGPI